MKFVAVDKINNPKSENNGMWVVKVSNSYMEPMKTVFMNKSKKSCIEYAASLKENPIVTNGVDYGAKF